MFDNQYNSDLNLIVSDRPAGTDNLPSYADDPNSPENQSAKQFADIWAKRITHDIRASAASTLSKQIRVWASTAKLEQVIALSKEIERQARG